MGLLAGIGGGNFASSMTNINAFFPPRKKGWALGLNAGGGNIGVPVIQLIALAIIGASGGPRVLLGIYIPLILIAAALAAPLHGQPHLREERRPGAAKDAARDWHTWIMAFLYIGTFGSVHRVRLRVRPGASGPVRPYAAAGRVPHLHRPPLLGSLISPRRRLARRPLRRREDHAVELRRHGRRHRHPGRRQHAEVPAAVRHRLHRPVRAQRARQRVDVQDDPRHLPDQGPREGTGG
ncbi:MFS transporter [Streptomyces sp. L7]